MPKRTIYVDKETDDIIKDMPQGSLSQACQFGVHQWNERVKTDLELNKKLLRLEETKKKLKEQEENLKTELEFETKKRKNFELLDREPNKYGNETREDSLKESKSEIINHFYWDMMEELYGKSDDIKSETEDPEFEKNLKLLDKFEVRYMELTKDEFKKVYNNIKPEARGYLIKELGEKAEGKDRVDLINEWFEKNSEKEVSNEKT